MTAPRKGDVYTKKVKIPIEEAPFHEYYDITKDLVPLYKLDEAGNPVYFCDDYVKMTGTYTVLTLDKVTDGTRKPQEFLLTADTANISADTNVSNTDDWK